MLKQTFQKLVDFIGHLPLVARVILVVDLMLLLIVLSGFFINRQVPFSYSGPSCVRDLTLLPDLSTVPSESGFSLVHRNTVSIAGLNLFSTRTCFVAKETPIQGEQSVSVSFLTDWLFTRQFTVSVGRAPTVDIAVLSRPVPTARALTIQLSQPDAVFDYQFKVGDDLTDCDQKDSSLLCDISQLDLKQGKEYTAQIDRVFNEQSVETVVKQQIKTLVATSIKKASIKNQQTVYSKPREIVVQFDKPIASAGARLLQLKSNKETEVETTASLLGDSMEITFSDDLDRGTDYALVIDNVQAKDGSTLSEPYKLQFSTSLGPKVTGVNVAGTGAALATTLTVTFDQAVDAASAKELIAMKDLSHTIAINGSKVSITYADANKCTDYTVSVGKGVKSKYEIVSDKTWSFTFRTVCHTTSVIGYSVQGRPITAYTFGNGSTTILYTGTIHGNELGAKALMYAWIDELEANATTIPGSRKIVVVPVVNPDGVAANQRYNAHTVDLNRNFDTEDWEKDVVTPANQPLPKGGGSKPMSEPETKAIAAFTTSLRPRLTVSFHGAAGYAIGNLGGDSNLLAAKYASLSGYSNQTGKSDTAFGYKITGTYDDWIHEALNLPSVLVELTSNSDSEFSRNKAALWAMLNA